MRKIYTHQPTLMDKHNVTTLHDVTRGYYYAVAVWGLLRGRILAGARGLRSNYYYKNDNPFSFYGFVLIYLSIGSFILYQSLL